MDWIKVGAAFGDAIGRGIEALGLGASVRAHYAEQFGKCRRCDAPLGGPSPSRICEPCHAAVVLSAPCVCSPTHRGENCPVCGGKG